MKHSKRAKARESLNQVRAEKKSKRDQKRTEAEEKAQIAAQLIKHNNATQKKWFDGDQGIVQRKAEKLFDINPYSRAVKEILLLPRVRSLETWEPRGKGRDTLFRSLCEHLFAKYRMPAFLWSAFLGERKYQQVEAAVLDIAKGGSLYTRIKDGTFTVPLTKKQCHSLLTSSADVPFMTAVRREQVLTHGGSKTLLEAWMRARGETLGTRPQEIFWDTVIAWFCKQAMMDMRQVGPLADYIANRYLNDTTFSMKGRGLLATIKAAEAWHGDLAKAKSFKFVDFSPSGHKPGNYECEYDFEHWKVVEILNNRELAAEGKALNHCVFSYSTSIINGMCSIWSLRKGSTPKVTLEIRYGKIVQARGKFNRLPDHEEYRYIIKWANENGLILADSGRW
jgi:hypothetical protein